VAGLHERADLIRISLRTLERQAQPAGLAPASRIFDFAIAPFANCQLPIFDWQLGNAHSRGSEVSTTTQFLSLWERNCVVVLTSLHSGKQIIKEFCSIHDLPFTIHDC